MFCEKCGSKIKAGYQFCTDCGYSSSEVVQNRNASVGRNTDERWWHRLLRVIYILTYLPLLGIIIAVWSSYAPYCYTSYSYNNCYGSYGEAFWYSLLALVIGVVVLRVAKLAVIYISKGQKPQWSKEFKKIY